MPANIPILADVIPSGLPRIDETKVEVAPVEKQLPAGEPPSAVGTILADALPPEPPEQQPDEPNQILYLGLFALAIAAVALFALFKRGASSDS